MITLLILALLSWTCGQSSSGKETATVNQEQAPISVGYGNEHTEQAHSPKLEQKDEIEVVAKVASPKTKDRPVMQNIPVSKVVVEVGEEVDFREEIEEGKQGSVNENLSEGKDEAPGDAAVELLAIDHSSFSTLLEKYVDAQGKVNYSGLKSEVVKLDEYLTQLDDQSVDDSWSRNEQLAYWINAYNAFTIKLILNNFPVSSITDLDGGKPWDKKWIDLGDKTYSLNQMENDIIRPQFNEPRIHFAVNCAAKSCPPLANKAFTASNLEALLESQTKKFINNTFYNKLAASQAQVSKIFDWYGSDFENVISFLNKYSAVKVNDNASLEFMEYNWSLNN